MKRTCVTSVALALLAGSAAGCRSASPPPAAPVPTAPEPTPPPAPAPVPIPEHEVSRIPLCVVQNGRFVDVSSIYNPVIGDSTVNGRPLHEVYPVTAEHAVSTSWYANNEPITFAGRRWVKYGLPRVLNSSEVLFSGTYQGVAVFVDAADAPARPTGYIYVVVSPLCEFQPYTGPGSVGAVRG